MIESLVVNYIRKAGALYKVSTNLGNGWGFGQLKTDEEDDLENGGLIVSMAYFDNEAVKKFVAENGLTSALIIPKKEAEQAIERGLDIIEDEEQPKPRRRKTRRKK